MTRDCALTIVSFSVLFCLGASGCLDTGDVAPVLVEKRSTVTAPRRTPRPRPSRPRLRANGTRLGLTITPLSTEMRRGAARVEDGRGHRVAPIRPVALDIDGLVRAGALDPVLHIGDRVFREYTYTASRGLRFVAADGASLAQGAAVTLTYGDVTIPVDEVR